MPRCQRVLFNSLPFVACLLLAFPAPAFAQCSPGNRILDGGFEAATGDPLNSPDWTETSVLFGSPLCSVALCNSGGGTAVPLSGTIWSWFGGTASNEIATLGQAVQFPGASASAVNLNFFLRIGAVTAPFTDVLNIKVDGVTQQTFTEPAGGEGSYTLRTVDLLAFANGATHVIELEYIHPGGGGIANFNVDDVTLDVTCGVVLAKDSIGLFNPTTQTFFLRNSNSSGPADLAFGYGFAGAVPIKGDWNGDGTDTIGVYDPATGVFYLRNTNTPGPADIIFQFGAGGAAVPLAGDWDGDGVDTIGLYIPATGVFFLRNSNSGGVADLTFSFGAGGTGRVPITGDWDNNGTDTIGLYIPATGVFFLRNANSTGVADLTFTFGAGGGGKLPITGDWDNDGSDTIGLYIEQTGVFFLRNSNTNGAADMAFTFGGGGAVPLAGDWDNLP